MSRFTPIRLADYPIADLIESLDFETYLARDRADFVSRWNARRAFQPALPAIETLLLESDPSNIVLQTGAYRELIVRARVNDALRGLTLAAARGRALDHIAMSYYRGLVRRVITPEAPGIAAEREDDDTFRARIALAPESWSTAGPAGAYLFYALSASGNVLDAAVYSEDEGVALAPQIRVVVLSRSGTGEADDALKAAVALALSRKNIRPVGDWVTIESAEPITFNVSLYLKLRNGASQSIVIEAARRRVEAYCSGQLRWIGDGISGPVWLIGRTLKRDNIKAAAFGGDGNIVDVDVLSPTTDINPADSGYHAAALSGVGSRDFTPLDAVITAHLFRAPRLGTVTITSEIVSGSWL
jgi:phage-related baseplate assembly protein